MLLGTHPAGGPETAGAELRVEQQPADRLGDRQLVERVDEQSRHTVDDRVGRAADIASDYRLAVRSGLQVDDPEALAGEAAGRQPAGIAISCVRRSHELRCSSLTEPRKRIESATP